MRLSYEHTLCILENIRLTNPHLHHGLLRSLAAIEYALEPDTAAELMRQVSFEKQIHNFEALLEVNIQGGVPLQPRLVSIRVH
jgi:hypothetical protein